MNDSPSRGEQTRQQIIQVAAVLFTQQGFHGTSMRQIAEQAGIALGGIYNHFSSKEILFKTILVERHPVHTVIPALLASQGDSVEAYVKDAARLIVETLGSRKDFLNLVFIELVEFNGAHLAETFNLVLPQVTPFLERVYQAKGGLRAIPPVLLFRSFVGLFISYVITEMMIGSTPTEEASAGTLDQFIDIYLHGILAKG